MTPPALSRPFVILRKAALVFLLANATLASGAPRPTRTFHTNGNPILGDGTYFSADAAPLSADGKLDIYAGHDGPDEQVGGFVMHDYGVFVTTDPKSGDWALRRGYSSETEPTTSPTIGNRADRNGRRQTTRPPSWTPGPRRPFLNSCQ